MTAESAGARVQRVSAGCVNLREVEIGFSEAPQPTQNLSFEFLGYDEERRSGVIQDRHGNDLKAARLSAAITIAESDQQPPDLLGLEFSRFDERGIELSFSEAVVKNSFIPLPNQENFTLVVGDETRSLTSIGSSPDEPERLTLSTDQPIPRGIPISVTYRYRQTGLIQSLSKRRAGVVAAPSPAVP